MAAKKSTPKSTRAEFAPERIETSLNAVYEIAELFRGLIERAARNNHLDNVGEIAIMRAIGIRGHQLAGVIISMLDDENDSVERANKIVRGPVSLPFAPGACEVSHG